MSEVPIVYVSNADVGKIIHSIGVKKKNRGLVVKAKKANQLASTFKDSLVNSTIPTKTRKKKTKKIENDQSSTEHEILAVAGSVELMNDESQSCSYSVYSFKTPKRANQMSKYATDSASKNQASLNDIENTNKVSNKRKTQDVSTTILNDFHQTRGYQLHDHDTCNQSDSDESYSDSIDDDKKENEQENSKSSTSSSRFNRLRSDVELYFEAHRRDKNKEVMTSDRTLQRLKYPQMSSSSLNKALVKHEKQIEYTDDVQQVIDQQNKLTLSYETFFIKWMFYLCNNFNLLLFGLGSKRNLIHSFCQKHLYNHDKLIVNGFFPAISLKSILTSIVEDVMNISDCISNSESLLEEINKHYSSHKVPDLFLIIHNIDGMNLRSTDVQSALSRLASLPKVHVIASIDQINAPLIWTQTILSRFRWLWFDVTTYSPYSLETSYEGSLLLSGVGSNVTSRGVALALSGLLHVARSLTSNARGVFRILAERHIEDKENKENDRIEDYSFSDLYQKSREKFLVNSELTLRAHLTEFIDHKLIQLRTGSDGCEYITVSVNVETLKDYLEQEENL